MKKVFLTSFLFLNALCASEKYFCLKCPAQNILYSHEGLIAHCNAIHGVKKKSQRANSPLKKVVTAPYIPAAVKSSPKNRRAEEQIGNIYKK